MVFAKTWALVGVSVKLNDNGISNDLNFRVGNGVGAADMITTTDDFFFHQFVGLSTGYYVENWIGTTVVAATKTNRFTGFV